MEENKTSEEMALSGNEEKDEKPGNAKLLRCKEWLQKQNELVPKKLSLQNQNDIQFIMECNAQRRNFLLKTAEDDISLPAGVDEANVVPEIVPIRRLRVHKLRMLCEWADCQCYYSDYEVFQKHVADHTSLYVTETKERIEYKCLWDLCGHKTTDSEEMVRHMNYHAYHAKLLAIGFNGRATLNLERCKKDSSKRNVIPLLKSKHVCMWTGCTLVFNAIQALFNHVKTHIFYAKGNLCSWAGCGAAFPRKVLLTMHARRHTGERLIACYHCGRHFACNRKLRDHLARQNVQADKGHLCHVCGGYYATAYLLREHTRQHVCAHECNLCDLSAPTRSALACHVLYRHVHDGGARCHPCPRCDYSAISKWDLKKHLDTHNRKRKKERDDESVVGPSDEEDSDGELKRKKSVRRKYTCDICPSVVFSRGSRLTTHLIKQHGAQWSEGYNRFKYQLKPDGTYRLTTTRLEFLELSQEIDGHNGPKSQLVNRNLKFDVKVVSEPTENTPKCLEITLENEDEITREIVAEKQQDNAVEITMCDVDEDGNIISSKVINSDVVFT